MKKLIYTLLAFATVCFSCVQDVDCLLYTSDAADE